ncbi:methyl-accepting chemotaxis protein [Amaricoccus macauensis]|uniref:methyl-accepting chemotaxis protein n=1 Tax=Amaricoccus macauensis TaxID=57001 RepID=UPI003C7E7A9A
MLSERAYRLSTRIYAIVALAVLLTAFLAWTLLSLAIQNAYDMRERHLSDVVDTAISILADLDRQVAEGGMTLDEAQAEGQRIMMSLTYEEIGYFYVFEHDVTIVAHPILTDWVGTNQEEYEDINGLKLFKELRRVALEEGGGAVLYDFLKPDTNVTDQKLGFAREFQPWGWIIGTGSYVSDIKGNLAHLRNVSLGVLGVSLIALLVISTILVRSVTGPIGGLIQRMKAMREGNIAAPVPHVEARGEIGDMARSIEMFRQAMQERERLAKEQAEKDAEYARQQEAAREKEREAEAREAEIAERHRQAEEQRRVEKEEARAQQEAERAAAEAERERLRLEQEAVVNTLANSLSAISKGDLGVAIQDAFPPAYEQLRRDFNEAVEHIAMLVGMILEGAASMRSDTESLSSATLALSQRTENQAASLEETAAAITELSASVDSSVEGAREATAAVSSTREMSETGREVVQRTVKAMSDIAQSSASISRITTVIEEIAFQTNLLALNAGVEASRAGDAGRGFAVVASEVRALAQRSSEAAREIATLIETSTRQVESGVTLVNESGTALEAIEQLVGRLNDLVNGVAETSSEQAIALSEISAAVNQLDQITQHNAAMFEETTVAVTSLRDKATELEQGGNSFTLPGTIRRRVA